MEFSELKWNPLRGTKKEGELIANIIGAELLTKNSATTLGIKKEVNQRYYI